jgi:hypothetical protein
MLKLFKKLPFKRSNFSIRHTLEPRRRSTVLDLSFSYGWGRGRKPGWRARVGGPGGGGGRIGTEWGWGPSPLVLRALGAEAPVGAGRRGRVLHTNAGRERCFAPGSASANPAREACRAICCPCAVHTLFLVQFHLSTETWWRSCVHI